MQFIRWLIVKAANLSAIKLKISGQVRGVGWRYWFAEQAVALDLKG